MRMEGSGSFRIWLASALVCALVGCGRPEPPPPPPPPAVTVSRPLQREVIEWDEYTGRLKYVLWQDVRARVSGLIESAPFQEGANVKKGDVLFVIDVRPFKADLDAKLADLAKAKAQLEQATSDLKRVQEAVKTSAVSERELDTAKAAYDSANAQVAAAQAAVDASRLDVEWCNVTAEIDGRISDKRVREGNLITGGSAQGTLLTTVISQDPIYCEVTVDEASVLKYARLAREGKRVSARYAKIPVFMGVAGESGFPHEGVVDFVDNQIDPNTGTVRARGVFPNPGAFLQPGMFARVRVPGSGRYQALLIPDEAIAADQNRRIVMTINADDIVEPHPVKLGALFGELRAIESGIGPDDRVIVKGLQRARPGTKVSPTQEPIPAGELQLTAPGSPTTQALPATRSISTTEPTTVPDGGAR